MEGSLLQIHIPYKKRNRDVGSTLFFKLLQKESNYRQNEDEPLALIL